ncbi:hypothetical protein DKX38_027199 [Salix brachista]|uniref:Uncharacterized protein n=1 Tax=Salix brachista TaxID=2182728 RepID=A0A5N5JBL7_9ROSI|nr:hypothetical protein DKX38_027199 [Salix brachista]
MSFQAGEAKGRTQEKVSTFMDKAGDAAQSATQTVQAVRILSFNLISLSWSAGVGYGTGSCEGVKKATGMNK